METPEKPKSAVDIVLDVAAQHGYEVRKTKGLPVNNCTKVDLGDGREAMMWQDENGMEFVTFESKPSQQNTIYQFHIALSNAGMDKFKHIEYEDYGILKELGGRNIKQLAKQTVTKGFFLWGNVGTGKTTLAVRIAYQRIADSSNVILYRWQDLLSKARSTMNTDTKESLQELMFPIKRTDLFILDELANKRRAKATDFEVEVFFDIVASRHGGNKPMLITSNMSPKDIEEVYGEALVSRLLDKEYMETIQFKGKDKRL